MVGVGVKALLLGVAVAVGLGIVLVTSGAKARTGRVKRVLAVGDSLTAGGYPKMLEQALTPGSEVIAMGFEGAGTQEIFTKALTELSSGDYDVIVVLAGVNDLTSNRGAEHAVKWLQRIYAEARVGGAEVVAVEILPWAGYPGGEARLPEARQLNQWINRVTDVDVVVNTSSMGDTDSRLLEKYDGGKVPGLHLNRAGNEYLAQLIATAIEKE
jgi:lysophospholipase L1-like esterase